MEVGSRRCKRAVGKGKEVDGPIGSLFEDRKPSDFKNLDFVEPRRRVFGDGRQVNAGYDCCEEQQRYDRMFKEQRETFSEHDRKTLEVDAFFFDDKRFVFDLSPDCADIFADDTDKDQLDGREEKESDDERRLTDAETVPINEFIDEISDGGQKAEERKCEACERREPKRKLRVVDESGHRVVVE